MKCFFVCFRYSAVMYDAVLLKLRKQPACGMEGVVKSLLRFPAIVSWERTVGMRDGEKLNIESGYEKARLKWAYPFE